MRIPASVSAHVLMAMLMTVKVFAGPENVPDRDGEGEIFPG
jgi:hypothetical protein